MKSTLKIVLVSLSILYIGFYVSIANTFILFFYRLCESVMMLSIIFSIVFLNKSATNRTKNKFKIIVLIGILIVFTHVLRIFYLLEITEEPFHFEYLFRSHLFPHTLNLIAIALAIGLFICVILWLSKQPRTKILKYLGIFLLVGLSLSMAFYLFNNRDLSSKGIYYNYEINTLEEIKELAVELDKTLYIDFWHSGCKPCLEEFANHQAFREQINSDKVHFLFMGTDVSIPGEKQKQRVLIEKYDLKGTHSFLSRKEFAQILDTTGYNDAVHGAKAFPHHMLINSDGQIVELQAEKPSAEFAIKLNSVGGYKVTNY